MDAGVLLYGEIKEDARRPAAVRFGDLLKDSGLPHATASSDRDDRPNTVMGQSVIWLPDGEANQLFDRREQLIPVVEHCHPLSAATKTT
jgi:hypothetical protein